MPFKCEAGLDFTLKNLTICYQMITKWGFCLQKNEKLIQRLKYTLIEDYHISRGF